MKVIHLFSSVTPRVPPWPEHPKGAKEEVKRQFLDTDRSSIGNRNLGRRMIGDRNLDSKETLGEDIVSFSLYRSLATLIPRFPSENIV